MKIFFYLTVLFALSNAAKVTIRRYMKNHDKDFDKTDIFEKYIVGSMGNYLSPKEF